MQQIIISILLKEHHSFQSGRPTIRVKQYFYKNVFEALNAHSHVDIIYTDFVKTFDRVQSPRFIEYFTGNCFWKATLIMISFIC